MRHLIICREYPPAPSGGIGTYVYHLSRLLAEAGEIVHVIGQMWERADRKLEQTCHGRLIIHRVPFEDWASLLPRQPHPWLGGQQESLLYKSGFPAQAFSWQAGRLAEDLVEKEGIDVIEAQDYEAPLYYFQLRRALGMGPRSRPACIVHLHSPTEFIARHNDWDMSLPTLVTAKRLEDYSIAAADALICPSRYLARQAEGHYGLAEGAIQVVPYPIGESRSLTRDASTWESGTICYVGRLERRKGIVEWVEAAVAVARQYPKARFEFVGADTWDVRGASIRELLDRRIPRGLKSAFTFRGQSRRSSLPRFLARARMAVVPSRWENFPNTCIEAMGSGLPVIASRQGGMQEMIEDGRTGWLASKACSSDLEEALRRALETPATRVAEMGRDAASEIRRICDNESVVAKHLELRSGFVSRGAKRSLSLPVNLPWARRPLRDESPRRTPQSGNGKGLAVVVTCLDDGLFLDDCLQSLSRQTEKPVSVIVVGDESARNQTMEALGRAGCEGRQVVHKKGQGLESAKNAAIQSVLDSGFEPLGFAFLSTRERLQPGFVAACESVLRRCPEVGIVSCWAQDLTDRKAVWIQPCPSFPYQWFSNEAASFSVARTEALREAGSFRPVKSQGYDVWDLFNAVMAAGWVAVTIPEMLVTRLGTIEANLDLSDKARGLMLDRFPDLKARDGKEVDLLVEAATARRVRKEVVLSDHLAMARVVLRYPRDPALRALGRLKNKIVRHIL